MNKYRYTLIVVFNTGTFHQTQVEAESTSAALLKLMETYRDGYMDGHNDIVSVTIAEKRELR